MMVNYIKQFNDLQEIYKKCGIEYWNNVCEEQKECENLKVIVTGLNMKKCSRFIENIKDYINETSFEDITEMIYDRDDEDNKNKIKFDTSAHLVIQVIDASQPVSKGDYRIYEQFSSIYNNIIFIVDRMEYVDNDEIEEIKEYVKEKVGTFKKNANVFYIYNSEIENNSDLSTYLKKAELNAKYLIEEEEKFKLNKSINECKKILFEKIQIEENWDSFVEAKKQKIMNLNKYIKRHGWRFSVFFLKQKEKLEKYFLLYNKEIDKGYIEEYFRSLISVLCTGYEKYIGSKLGELKKFMEKGIIIENEIEISSFSILEQLRQAVVIAIDSEIKKNEKKIKTIGKERKNNYINILKDSIKELEKISGEIIYGKL